MPLPLQGIALPSLLTLQGRLAHHAQLHGDVPVQEGEIVRAVASPQPQALHVELREGDVDVLRGRQRHVLADGLGVDVDPGVHLGEGLQGDRTPSLLVLQGMALPLQGIPLPPF